MHSMNEPIYFSVIIPTYNRAELIVRTLESVLKQDYQHFEVLLIDDGSTDNTKEVVETLNDKRITYVFKENEERGKARNTGINLAKGEYVTFLDSDDVMYPNHLSHANIILQKNNNPEFYKQGHEVRNEVGRLLASMNKIEGNANEFILKGNYFSCIGIFLRTDIANKIQFNNDRYLSPSEDWDYWLRLSVRYKIHYDNTITACMLEHRGRSVHQFNNKLNKLVISRFINSLKNDALFSGKKGYLLPKIKAQMYTLFCLNKVVSGNNKKVVPLFLYACSQSPRELFRRRTLAIVKYYLQNIIK